MAEKESEIVIKINAKLALVLGIFLGIFLIGGFLIFKPDGENFSNSKVKGSSIETVTKVATAAEIYPKFVCTCCGQPLDKNNICCGIAEDMISYIDTQVEEGLEEDEVVLTTVKKYGLKSLASEDLKEGVKEQLAQSASPDSSKISIDPLSYDFGEVSQAKGEISHSFIVENIGKSDLVINNLLTSCGCTSVTMVIDGKEGPRFSMHNNPKNWTATLKPDEKAELKVYYDPNVHKDFKGAATREITIFSNDPVDFEKSVKIKLNQVD